jgi:hypothetical protein
MRTARTYANIGAVFTAIVGIAMLILGMINYYWCGVTFIVIGFLSLILAVFCYITTSEKIRTGDQEGAKGYCLGFGILLLIFGGIIGGIFLLLAHSKLMESVALTAPSPPTYGPSPRYPQRYQPPRYPTTESEFSPVGFLECKSGPDRGVRLPIDKANMTIGRSPERKTGGNNDLQLSDQDVSVSTAQGSIRVDRDTGRVYIRHDADTSKTLVDGGILIPGEWKELRNGSEIEFGTRGAKWRFVAGSGSERRETE